MRDLAATQKLCAKLAPTTGEGSRNGERIKQILAARERCFSFASGLVARPQRRVERVIRSAAVATSTPLSSPSATSPARRSAGSNSAPNTKRECDTKPSQPRDVVLSQKAWNDLVQVNDWVNDNVKPMTDLEHWGVVERWNYPDDGYGDCEDYVLLKRRMLMQAGWPREALLITVVRDKKGEGHAVLTVKTDQRRIHSRQPGERNPALVEDRLPLREAPVAVRSERLGLARRSARAPATASAR